jgi:hypothetical protein
MSPKNLEFASDWHHHKPSQLNNEEEDIKDFERLGSPLPQHQEISLAVPQLSPWA